MPGRFATNLIYEALTPQPDGVNTTFSTSEGYSPNSVVIWIDGQRKDAELDDGFTEVPPTGVELKETLPAGATLEVEYVPVSNN